MADVNVIKRRTTGVSEDTGDLVKIDMENISPASFSTPLAATKAVTAPAALTLTVVFAGGVTPVEYQWFKDNNAIAGATAATYTKAATVAGTDSGVYKVVARDAAGNLISSSSVVTVS